MKVTVFATTPEVPLMDALTASGVEPSLARLPEPEGGASTSGLVMALRAAEEALDGTASDAAVVAGNGDQALAALLTAVKLRVPAGWLGAPGEYGELLGRVADLRLDATDGADALVASILELAAPSINGS